MQLMDAEDKRSRCGTGECVLHLAQSKTPSTRRRSSYGTWEASSPPRAASLGRVRKGNTENVPRVRWRGVEQRHTTGEAREQWSEKACGEGGGKDVDQGKPREACRRLDTAPGHCVAGTAQGAPEGASKDGRTIHRATSPRDASAPGG